MLIEKIEFINDVKTAISDLMTMLCSTYAKAAKSHYPALLGSIDLSSLCGTMCSLFYQVKYGKYFKVVVKRVIGGASRRVCQYPDYFILPLLYDFVIAPDRINKIGSIFYFLMKGCNSDKLTNAAL